MDGINLKGKKALVTGGSQGIGAQICRELASHGADVFINYFTNKEKAEILASELRETFNVNVCIGVANVSKPNEVEAMFQLMDKKLNGIDILINNAGSESNSHILDLDVDEWDRVININLKGPFLCAQQAGRRMEKSGGGVIINISSIHDTVPRKGLTHYCTAKGGLKMFTKCLALELAESNIRVISVAPGAIETEMNRKEIANFGVDKFQGWIPQGRIGNVKDVSPTIAFLCSDMASYMTGIDIYIDGGYMQSTIPYDPRPPRKI
ncbi:glucose 1-dehydrogenase [Aureibaculum algae]|uniref:Glucose 1-dehydrogenase n=1 Tax=Aureibaculum algae TaxID=2584122 RepID=A0A5B7U086_9FLAO|nr:glucose 1-dehydrogenase [Aureibaculum algae]QCX40407.1 glucose 1-dehydrogenase [Aureibaculum algae]